MIYGSKNFNEYNNNEDSWKKLCEIKLERTTKKTPFNCSEIDGIIYIPNLFFYYILEYFNSSSRSDVEFIIPKYNKKTSLESAYTILIPYSTPNWYSLFQF